MFQRRLLLVAAVLLWGAWAHAGGTVSQTFELRPGWNAVYLEVQPDPLEPAAVFESLPVESVWTWFDRQTSVQFLQNPSEPNWAPPGWGVYVKDPAKAFLSTLYGIRAGRAYLVKLGGGQAVTWSVTGVPSAQRLQWTTDSFNLVGFPVSPTDPPTFATLLGGSPALTGQPVYRLGASGTWELVDAPASARPRSGEAYWVYCKGASEYQGALDVQLPTLGGLNFGAFSTELTVALRNASSRSLTVRLTPLSGDVDLAYRSFNATTGAFDWPPLAAMEPLVLAPGTWKNVRIAVRREALTAERANSTVAISDNLGTRLLVPVHVEKEAVR